MILKDINKQTKFIGGIDCSFINGDLSTKRLLDFGSGDGKYTSFFLQKGLLVSSVDIDASSESRILKQLTEDEKRRFTFSYLNAEKSSISGLGCFDYIVCREVLEHIKNYEQLVCGFYDALKSGGTLVISIPTSFTEKYFYFWDRKWLERCEHVNVFKKRDIISLAKKYKFSVKKIGRHSFRRSIFWALVAPFRIDHKMGKINEKHKVVKVASFLSDCICYFSLTERLGNYLLPKSYVFYLQKKL